MAILKIERALAHLRIDSDIDDDVVSKLHSAEDVAQQYLNRYVYADIDALNTARDSIPAKLTAIKENYTKQVESANASNDPDLKNSLIETANLLKQEGMGAINKTLLGIVLNPSIEAAILLILGHLYENREDVSSVQVSKLPKGATFNLDPYRIQLGV